MPHVVDNWREIHDGYGIVPCGAVLFFCLGRKALVLKDGQTYSGRRADKVVRNFTYSAEADAVKRLYCLPGRKELGKFIERLLFEHHAREEERKRIINAIVASN
jgi:hypothetical protein